MVRSHADPATAPSQVPAAAPARAVRAATRRLAMPAAVAGLMLLAGCAFGPPTGTEGGSPPNLPTPTKTPATDPPAGPPSVAATVLVRNLDIPWAVDFLPDGTALVTERDTRRILRVGPGLGTNGLLVSPVQTITEATARGEGGLLGLAVSPDYGTDRTIFIYYTTDTDNRIARLRLGERPQPLVTGIPASGVHNGGRLHFGPDGYLYASTGDATERGLAQDRASLAGKILRMTTEGKPAPGNPFPDSLVWTYGHRNVQGFAWNAQGRMFATEFGQDTWDEINLIEPGRNYGWPAVEGAGSDRRYVNPIQQWPTDEASCSGAAMVGDVLVTACLRGTRLWLLKLTANGTLLGSPIAVLVGTYGRLRAAVVAPDGSLWVTTSNRSRGRPAADDDRILRIVVGGGGGLSQT